MSNFKMGTAQRIIQHKRFVPGGTHPNSAFGGTSFMLETLYEMLTSEQNMKVHTKTNKRRKSVTHTSF